MQQPGGCGPRRGRRRRGRPARPSTGPRARWRRSPRRLPPGGAVEETHHALDHRDVGRVRRARPVGEQRRDWSSPTSHGSRLRPGRPGREGVVAGVDVVGADLVRQTRGRGRAARARARSRRSSCRARAGAAMTTRGTVHHSMPGWPFWPASIGCLIFVISATRSAAVDEVGVRVAAGDDDVLGVGASGQRRTTSSTSIQPHLIG